MLDILKVKEYDLEPVYAEWKDAPRFTGNRKKDPMVDAWLDQIKAGCVERKVPEEYWHKVAQHYMGDKALARLDEVKKVLYQMNGGKYHWTWKKFRLMMCNMGWEIDSKTTETLEVKHKRTGSWWVVGKKKDSAKEEPAPPRPPPKKPVRSNTAPVIGSAELAELGEKVVRGSGFFWSRTREAKSPPKPQLLKAVSAPVVVSQNNARPRPPSRSNTVDGVSSSPDTTVTTVAQAPAWLLNACHALDSLTQEHPKAMTALSAILITAGTAIPGLGLSAGVPLLSTHAVQAAGTVAVGLGNWIRAQQNHQVQASSSQ